MAVRSRYAVCAALPACRAALLFALLRVTATVGVLPGLALALALAFTLLSLGAVLQRRN